MRKLADARAADPTGAERVAIVLMALGPAASTQILKQMPEDDVEMITSTIARLQDVDSRAAEATLEDFHQQTTARAIFIRGGLGYARKLLIETYGPNTAMRLLDRLTRTSGQDGVTFEDVRKADPQQLAKFIRDEHPQTIALILSHFDATQAAALLAALPTESRVEVIVRMAELDQISPDIARNIVSVIGNKLRDLGELNREAGGIRSVANMFNRLDPNTCSQLLQEVEETDPSLFENIRRFMFVFGDLDALDTAAIRELMAKVERRLLLIALKGANENLVKKFLQSQSQRAATMMQEDMAALGPVKLRDVDAAQQQIITLARELEKAGVISLQSSPADQYIT
jgi:flagellar motor switch protein FliG